jgi:hypothetical protein
MSFVVQILLGNIQNINLKIERKALFIPDKEHFINIKKDNIEMKRHMDEVLKNDLSK